VTRRRTARDASLVALAAAALLAAAGAAPAAAQGAGGRGQVLERIAAAADSGAVDEARRELDRWLAAGPYDLSPAERARADFLRGRLAADPDSAVTAYTRVAVGGQAPWAAAARLRLAQLRLARGDYDHALSDLATLRADFPGDSLAQLSWVWTGSALAATGDTVGACRAWGRAAGKASERAAVRSSAAGCRGGPAPSAAAAGQGSTESWAVQMGAFSTRQAASELLGRLSGAGFDARILDASRDGLYRVRSPEMGSSRAAEKLRERLEAAGFSALIVQPGPGG